MAIRKSVQCFVGGALVKMDLDEKGKPLSAAAPVKAAVAAVPALPGAQAQHHDDGPTKQELMAQLKAAGVKFHATASKAELSALLAKAKKAATPEPPKESPAPPAETPEVPGGGGTGNQDVI